MTPDPTVTAVSDELLLPFLDEMSKHANWCRKNVSDAANCTCPAEAAQHEAAAIRKRVAELLRARSALADVGENDYTKRGGLSSEGKAGALLATEETGTDRPAAPNYGDGDGPGEEDGPWVDGWEERKSGKQPLPSTVALADVGEQGRDDLHRISKALNTPNQLSPESKATLENIVADAYAGKQPRPAAEAKCATCDALRDELDLTRAGLEFAKDAAFRLSGVAAEQYSKSDVEAIVSIALAAARRQQLSPAAEDGPPMAGWFDCRRWLDEVGTRETDPHRKLCYQKVRATAFSAESPAAHTAQVTEALNRGALCLEHFAEYILQKSLHSRPTAVRCSGGPC